MLIDPKPQLVETVSDQGELSIHIDMSPFSKITFEQVKDIRD